MFDNIFNYIFYDPIQCNGDVSPESSSPSFLQILRRILYFINEFFFPYSSNLISSYQYYFSSQNKQVSVPDIDRYRHHGVEHYGIGKEDEECNDSSTTKWLCGDE